MAVSFDTVFKIGAVFTGAAAMTQAQTAITNLEQKGILAGANLKKMVLGLGGLAAGALTVDKITGFINNSIDAARKAKAAYQGISDALGKVPQLQKLGTAAIKDQSDKLKELAITLQRTGVIASESLAAGFSKFIDEGFSPAKIGAMSAGFQDIVVRIKGVKATAEDATDVADKLGQAILKGGQEGGQALVNLGVITQDQVEKFASLQSANARYNYTLGEMGKHVSDTANAMKTWEGVQQRFSNVWKDLKVAIGTPFMEAQDKVTAKMAEVQQKLVDNAAKISNIVTPILTKYADKLGDFFVSMVDNLDKYGPQIDKWLGVIDTGFGWFLQFGDQIAKAIGWIADEINKLASGKIDDVAKDISNLGTSLIQFASKIDWKQIGVVIGQGFLNMFKFDMAVYGTIGQNIGASLAKVDWNMVFNLAGQAIGMAVKGIFYAVFVLPKDLGTWIGNELKKLDWKWILDQGITNVLEGAGDIGVNIINGIIQGVTGKDMHEIGDALWKACTSWAAPLPEWFMKNIIDPCVDLFKNLPQKIGDAMSKLGEILLNVLKNAWNTAKAALPFGMGNLLPGFQQSETNQKAGGNGIGVGAAQGIPAGVAISPEAAAGATAPMRAMGFGPAAGDTNHAANYSQYGSGPPDASGKHLLTENDIAVSPEYLGKFPMGSYVDIVKNGKVLYTHQKVADTSWYAPGKPTHGFEQRHVDDLGTAQLVKSAAFGGIFSHPSLTAIAERVPEMALPLEGTSRSRSLLSSAAERIGMGSMLRGGGGGPMHFNMTAPITIHGVQAGQEGAIAREVQKALEDPIRRLLDQLKKAKAHEQRLSYA